MIIVNNMFLGKTIKNIRLKLGKSQEEFGKLFDPPAPKSAVSRWEHGGSPNKKRLAQIAKLGHIPLDELINGTLLEAVSNLGSSLYTEYFNYLKYMDVEGNDVRTYIVEAAQRNTESRLIYKSVAEFFSYVELERPNDLKKLFEYYAGEVYTEARIQEIKSTDTLLLLNLFVDVAKRRVFEFERNNTGLINSTIEELDDLSQNVSEFVYGYRRDTLFTDAIQKHDERVELPNKIDKELFNSILKVLEDAKTKILKLGKDHHVEIKNYPK